MKRERRDNPPRSSHQPKERSFTAQGSDPASKLNLAEKEIDAGIGRIESHTLHHCDRPEVEVRVLAFLAHAIGPTTEGIARELGISAEAAAVHLHALHEARRIWSQPSQAGEMSWHISQEGRNFLAERAPTENEPPE